ncbi:MAG: hypothetical protein O2984_05160, partial [Bacteroidetes bacterium]|nr:hypothetical protein [Bacteroidota bacterium]
GWVFLLRQYLYQPILFGETGLKAANIFGSQGFQLFIISSEDTSESALKGKCKSIKIVLEV